MVYSSNRPNKKEETKWNALVNGSDSIQVRNYKQRRGKTTERAKQGSLRMQNESVLTEIQFHNKTERVGLKPSLKREANKDKNLLDVPY